MAARRSHGKSAQTAPLSTTRNHHHTEFKLPACLPACLCPCLCLASATVGSIHCSHTPHKLGSSKRGPLELREGATSFHSIHRWHSITSSFRVFFNNKNKNIGEGIF